jgi:hypothetical protein
MAIAMEISEVVTDSDNRITAICNISKKWAYSAEKAQKLIQSGKIEFYVTSSEGKVPVVVGQQNEKAKLSTTGSKNLLLDMERCTIDQAIRYLTQ